MPRRAHAVPLPWVRVDRDLGIPAERQICGSLRDAIRRGLLQRGFRMPSVRQLALELDVSRRVVAVAYARLEAEGYLAAKRGGTTFVNAEASLPRRASASLAASSRAQTMPEHATHGLLAPGSVAADAFPWRQWRVGSEVRDAREAIATQLCPMRGIIATPEEIVLASDVESALVCAAELVADPGDLALVENPGDPRTRALFDHCGLRLRADRIDSEGLAFDATAESPRLVHVRAPISPGRQYLLLQFAKATGAAIVEEDDGAERALKALDTEGRAIFIGSLRNALPHAGLAYLVIPAELAPLAARLAIPPAPMLESALADFIERGEMARHLARLRDLHEERRDALTSALHRTLGTTVHGITRGNALELIVWLAPHLDDREVAAAAMREGLAPLPLSTRAIAAGDFPPALILGYGAVTPCDAADAVAKLARAIDRCDAARKLA
jgi:GntR family transcriptional regulator/MocR family aminotransferase